MELLAVFTTVSSAAQAETLATGAVEAGLAACVHAEAITSTYRWRGKLEKDSEVRLLFKTTASHYPALQAWITQHHPYELPAVFALAVSEASPAYAAWVEESVNAA